MSPTLLWVSNFGVKLGVGNTIFEITIFTWLFKYLGPNLSFFFLFFFAFFRFDEKCKNLFYHSKLKKLLVPSLSLFSLFFIEFILFFARTSANNEEVTASIDFLPTRTMSLLGPAQDLRRVWWGRVGRGIKSIFFSYFVSI